MKAIGLSHTISQLGDVASWVDLNTRKEMTHPMSAKIKNSNESSQRVVWRRFMSRMVNDSTMQNMMSDAHIGDCIQGVARSCAPFGAPAFKILVCFTNGIVLPVESVIVALDSIC